VLESRAPEHPARTVVTATDLDKARDAHDLLVFSCAGREGDEPHEPESLEEDVQERYAREQYVQEVLVVQEFIRRRLVHCQAALIFRLPEGRIVAASGFRFGEAGPARVPCWHLEVVGVSTAHHGRPVFNDFSSGPPTLRISECVLRTTFERMRQLDPTRQLVTARVHDVNMRSIRACARVGLCRQGEPDGGYWEMTGDVDPYIGW
jgi:hypothetical protein